MIASAAHAVMILLFLMPRPPPPGAPGEIPQAIEGLVKNPPILMSFSHFRL